METRANHLLIGTFVLLMIAGAFGFIMWLAKVQVDVVYDRYYVYFDGSVSGLSTAGEVRYNGILVGSVTEIVIDPDDPRRARVTIELDTKTPVREDTVASLELRGITGVSYVNLSTASPDSPPLKAKPGQTLPVIPSKRSEIQELFSSAPQALDRFIVVMNRAALFLDDDNRLAVKRILANAEDITAKLSTQMDALPGILDNVARTSESMRETADSMRGLTGDIEHLIGSVEDTLAVARGTMAGVDEVVSTDLKGMAAESRTTLQSITRTSDEVHAMLAENREAIHDFSTEGLYELSRFVIEARFLVGGLTRLVQKIEADPAQFLFGGTQEGFEAK